jgi:hypothetical protein
VDTIVTPQDTYEMKITEVAGPWAPSIGDYATVPATEGPAKGEYTLTPGYVQTYGPPLEKGGMPRRLGMDTFEGTYTPATNSMKFTVARKGAVAGTSWTFTSMPCMMPEPPTHILWVIGLAGTVAYGWRLRRKQRRQRPVVASEAIA